MKAVSWLKRCTAWFRATLSRRVFERDLDEEILFHLEEHARALIARGVPAREAHRQARVAFGGAESSRDRVRSAMGLRPLDGLFTDLRYAVRVLRNSPGFTSLPRVSLLWPSARTRPSFPWRTSC